MDAALKSCPSAARHGLALFAFGFRPFFLLAGAFAALSVPLWLLVQQGLLETRSPLGPAAWHGHEMLFGFTVAVVAGFLLTATSNWTGLRTATGAGLAALTGLWLAARVLLMAGGAVPAGLAAAVDVAFLPTLAAVLLVPILRTGNRRNLVFPVVLLALAALNLSVHLGALGLIDWDPSRGLRVGAEFVVLMIVVIGGRVIPAFTRNALPRSGATQSPREDVAAIAATLLAILSDLAFGGGPAVGAAALAAGLANAVRLRRWGGLATLGAPILWVLHLGYAWVAIGFLLRALAELTAIVPVDASLHALTTGAIGTMALGMMSRVALGHTGRRLVAAPPTAAAYAVLLAAGLARVAAALAPGPWYDPLLLASGALWSLAFLFFTAVYLPILARPRPDGRPG